MDMRIIGVALVLASLVACTTPNNNTPQQGTQGLTGAVTAGSTPQTGNTVEINMTARDFAFDPGVIHAHQGDRVIIHLTSADTTHGILIQGYDVHAEAAPGQTQTLEFVADKTGTFTFHCDVPCGPGHREMTGELIVE